MFYLLGVAQHFAQRQQRAINCVRIEIEKAGFLDQAPGLNEPATPLATPQTRLPLDLIVSMVAEPELCALAPESGRRARLQR